ncbi:hypothetical protein Gotri_023588 [Gossypium trilobum]|uniref:Electron transporter n=1 Tax=Gossypium trilobum TaxID=34281 RepID=A0A7J9DJJ3_9ROSI|nr:hypothetical protein [Gossypium trilobum]
MNKVFSDIIFSVMGFQSSVESKMLGLKFTSSKHKRSKSFPEKRRVEEDSLDGSLEASNRIKLDMRHLKDSVKTRNKQSPSPGTEVQQNSLKQEILQLEKRLQDQFEVRRALETALGYRTSSHDNRNETSVSITKPATELIKEIAVLELEVVYLEQYLLLLYRKAFDQQVSSISLSKRDERIKTPLDSPRGRFSKVSRPDDVSKVENLAVRSSYCENPCEEPSVHRCHSSLSQHSVLSSRTSPLDENLDRAIRACHSQPLSMTEFPVIYSMINHQSVNILLLGSRQYAQNASNIISLAEHLGTRISDHVPETPNKLSEDMIKCMAAIYCKLADPPLIQNGFSSPNSSMSSASAFSPRQQHDMWSPGFRNNSSFDVRSLICRLEEIDPMNLKHEEKLAFWINIHNSLVMHAFLAYGIPQNNVKRLFLLLRAAYNIGGHTISADTIQSSILGCRISRPGQWLRLLLSSKTKFKTGDEKQAYAIKQPEPLLYFALCTGNHSDPAIRAYTPKRVFQELETAKEEYIRATFGVRKDQKILLPKIIESFAKDSSLDSVGIIEMVEHALPESLRRSIRKCQLGKSRKNIAWIPRNFTFRYLISKELLR